jgi:hypothetical protein
MNFGKSAVFCLGIAVALWVSPRTSSAETLNNLTAPQAGSSADLSIWFGWDAKLEDSIFTQRTMYGFVGDPELKATTFESGWASLLRSDGDHLDNLLLANQAAGWNSDHIPELVNADAEPPKVSEPDLWVLVACGLSFVVASAGLRRRFRTVR